MKHDFNVYISEVKKQSYSIYMDKSHRRADTKETVSGKDTSFLATSLLYPDNLASTVYQI